MRSRSNPALTLLATLITSLATPLAQAKNVGDYQLRITAESFGGGATDWGALLLGWACTSSTELSFKEKLRDYTGVEKLVDRDVKNHTSGSFITHPEIKVEFTRNMDISQNIAHAVIAESCTKFLSTDSSKDLYLDWSCDFDRLPQKAGETVQSTCHPSRTVIPFGLSLSSLALAGLKQKTINAEFTLDRVEERYAQDYCKGQKDNRVVIQLTQGVGGHFGEDDFVFKVKVDDQPEFEIRTEHGTLDEEILYCGAKDEVKVAVKAIEEDLLFDDKYKGDGPDGFAEVSVPRKGADNWKKAHLKRRSYFGRKYKDVDVMVVVKEKTE